MDSKTLIDSLAERELIQKDIAIKILREATLVDRPVEELLAQRRLVDDESIAKTKSEVLKIPYKKVDVGNIPADLMSLLPAETVRTYKAIPISRDKNLLIIGMVNPDDERAQEALRFIAKQQRVNLGVYLVSSTAVDELLRRYSPFKSDIEGAVRALTGSGVTLSPMQKIVRLEEGVNVSEDAPIIKIVKRTIEEAVSINASDVHIEPQRNRLRIRIRLDGDLQEVSSLPIELAQPVVSRVKVLSNLKLDESRIPQDGRFRSIVFDRDIDFRVSTFPTPVGEKVAIRVLDPTVGLKGIDRLGFTDYNVKVIEEALDRPYGMILATGPTGSGKTTTLYAILQKMNNENLNIVSLEDPVEYFVDGLNQSQVHPEIGYDFASGLRQILRQDPDVILVGEVRDNETAALVVHAALTGHVVLSSLHTNDVLGVVPRLIDMKVEPFLLPAALNLMLAQRLVPLLCQSCKEEEEAPKNIQLIIQKEFERLPEQAKSSVTFKSPYKVFRSKGCNVCNNKGFTGRMAIQEILRMTDQFKNMLNSLPTVEKISEEARRQGMVSMRQDGIIKALQGLIGIEEVVRETVEM